MRTGIVAVFAALSLTSCSFVELTVWKKEAPGRYCQDPVYEEDISGLDNAVSVVVFLPEGGQKGYAASSSERAIEALAEMVVAAAKVISPANLIKPAK